MESADKKNDYVVERFDLIDDVKSDQVEAIDATLAMKAMGTECMFF